MFLIVSSFLASKSILFDLMISGTWTVNILFTRRTTNMVQRMIIIIWNMSPMNGYLARLRLIKSIADSRGNCTSSPVSFGAISDDMFEDASDWTFGNELGDRYCS